MQDCRFCRRRKWALHLHGLDDGMGITPERLKALNRGDDIASTQGSDEKAEHGLGLKLVAQIVKVHRGIVSFSANAPHGLEVRISLPTQPLIS